MQSHGKPNQQKFILFSNLLLFNQKNINYQNKTHLLIFRLNILINNKFQKIRNFSRPYNLNNSKIKSYEFTSTKYGKVTLMFNQQCYNSVKLKKISVLNMASGRKIYYELIFYSYFAVRDTVTKCTLKIIFLLISAIKMVKGNMLD